MFEFLRILLWQQDTFEVLQLAAYNTITESVDSVCRDGTDMPYVQYKHKLGNLCQKHSHRLSKVPDLHRGVFCNIH